MPNSILALGIQPVLLGFTIVELAALIVPPWAPLRTGGPSGRQKLRQAALRLGMLLALGQAFFLAAEHERAVSGRYGLGFVITVVVLVGATAALIGLARVVDEEGLGGGLPILLLVFALPGIAWWLERAYLAGQHGALPASAWPTVIFGLALLVAAPLWLFSRYCLPGTDAQQHPALVSRPACGLAPLGAVAFVIVFVTNFFRRVAGQRVALPSEIEIAPLLLVMLVAIGFAYLFNRPDRVSAVWKALSPDRPGRPPRIKPALLECVLFIAVVFLIDSWLVRLFGNDRVPRAVPVILVTAIIADIVREWRAGTGPARLIPIWEIHQVYAVPPAVALLQAQGFHPFAKGLRLRSLLQFFGPYAPILIVVPVEEAQAAYKLLEERWPVLDQAASGV
jgi:hypothetical protein